MRVLISIGHPAHVHYFKNFIFQMKDKGHEVIIVAKDRNITHTLLEYLKLSFIKRTKYPSSFLLKLLRIPFSLIYFLRLAKKVKPDLMMGVSSVFIAQAGYVLGIPSIVFDDTDNASLTHKLYKPFASCILSPDCFQKSFGDKHLKFRGYMELGHLHPSQYKPNKTVLQKLNVKEGELYSIVRFVSWSSNHDLGHAGISIKNKINAVKTMAKYGHVFITSETPLPKAIEKYRYKIPPYLMHDAMAFASVLYGESATMASESAIMGVPAIYVDNDSRGYTKDIEKTYGLIYNYTESAEDQEQSIIKAEDILKNKSKNQYKEKHVRLINDKIDVTSFFVWFIENYPKSKQILKENPEYQLRFITPAN